ncbi:hypothetical protein [Borreliella americana]|nr:hypothetical protein [Borreliella americana]MCD2382582.1 hypothetical protein [Borreliella americana]
MKTLDNNSATKVSGKQILNEIIMDAYKSDEAVLTGADNNPIGINRY